MGSPAPRAGVWGWRALATAPHRAGGVPLSIAARVPATLVPWPPVSAKDFPLVQLMPPTTLRSGWVTSMPESRTATSTLTRSSIPSILAVGL